MNVRLVNNKKLILAEQNKLNDIKRLLRDTLKLAEDTLESIERKVSVGITQKSTRIIKKTIKDVRSDINKLKFAHLVGFIPLIDNIFSMLSDLARLVQVIDEVQPSPMTTPQGYSYYSGNTLKEISDYRDYTGGFDITEKNKKKQQGIVKIIYRYKGITNEQELFDIIKYEYELKKEQLRNGFEFENLVLRRDNLATGRPKGFTIPAQHFLRNGVPDYDLFKKRLEDQIEGNVDVNIKGKIYKSDAFNEDEELDYSYFYFVLRYPLAAGDGDDMVFECIGTKSGDCLNDGMMKMGFPIPFKTNSLDVVRDYIIKYNLRVNIIENTLTWISDEKYNLIIGEDVMFDFIYFCGDKDAPIGIYNPITKHFDVVKRPIKISKGVHFDNAGNLLITKEDDREVLISKSTAKNDDDDSKYRKKYVFFKFEAYEDVFEGSISVPYAIHVLKMEYGSDETLIKADKSNTNEDMEKYRKKMVKTFVGSNCIQNFAKWLESEEKADFNGKEVKFILIGFHNAEFDNRLLYDGLMSCDNIRLSTPFMAGGTDLYQFSINKRHQVWDLGLHLVEGSLSELCEHWELKHGVVKPFDHKTIQNLYNQLDCYVELTRAKMYKRNSEVANVTNAMVFLNQAEQLPELIEKVIYSGQYNVIAIALIFYGYKHCLNFAPEFEKYSKNLTNYMTLASMVERMDDDYTRTLEVKSLGLPGVERTINLPKGSKNKTKKIFGYDPIILNAKQLDDHEEHKYGARVDCFQGKIKVNDVVYIDCCSLYPYIMCIAKLWYPSGNPIPIQGYALERFGRYFCESIDQSSLWENGLKNIVPIIVDDEKVYQHREIVKNIMLDSVTIEHLRKYGCIVHIKEGYYYPNKIRSVDRFKHLLKILRVKHDQDILKKEGKPYNPSVRFTFKLLGNALSGKLNQSVYRNKFEMVDSHSKFYYRKDNFDNVNVVDVNSNLIYLTYIDNRESLIKNQKEVAIGAFIYSYARMFMYESTLGFKNSFYHDTDSNAISRTDFNIFKETIFNNNIQPSYWDDVLEVFPEYKTHRLYESDSKLPGTFEIEFEAAEAIFFKKKMYAMKSKEGKVRFRISGISQNSVWLKDQTETMTNKASWELYNYPINSVKLKDAQWEIANYLYNHGRVNFLVQTLDKTVSNSYMNVGLDDVCKFNNALMKVKITRKIIPVSCDIKDLDTEKQLGFVQLRREYEEMRRREREDRYKSKLI